MKIIITKTLFSLLLWSLWACNSQEKKENSSSGELESPLEAINMLHTMKLRECKINLAGIARLQKAHQSTQGKYSNNLAELGFRTPGTAIFSYAASTHKDRLGAATLQKPVQSIPAGTHVCIDESSVISTDSEALQKLLQIEFNSNCY